MKRIVLLLAFVLGVSAGEARKLEVPTNYQFGSPERYAAYEKDVLKCSKWLIKTPLDKDPETRKAAGAFISKWAMGSPDVTVNLNLDLLTFMRSSPTLFRVYIAGSLEHSLKTGNYKDNRGSMLAGLEAVVKVYKKNKKTIKPDPNVEKYAEMSRKELREFVNKHTK